MDVNFGHFFWDDQKEAENILKHGIDFKSAARAFLDAKRKIYMDPKHSGSEDRLFCVGKVDGKIMTVRYTKRELRIRIIGAGYWRQGRKYYNEKETA